MNCMKSRENESTIVGEIGFGFNALHVRGWDGWHLQICKLGWDGSTLNVYTYTDLTRHELDATSQTQTYHI